MGDPEYNPMTGTEQLTKEQYWESIYYKEDEPEENEEDLEYKKEEEKFARRHYKDVLKARAFVPKIRRRRKKFKQKIR
jgi:hypothetical protein